MSAELKPPLVSIIITSCNYAKYVRDALESVAAQTYRPLECIVVDDCSTDDSVEVITRTLDGLRRKNDGISYSLVSTERNSGQLAAFQLGITRAKGIFVNFLDADDFLLPEFISVHVQVQLESLVAFTFSEPVEIDSQGQVHCFQSNTGDVYQVLKMARNIRPVVSFDQWRRNLSDCSAAKNFVTSADCVLDVYNHKWNTWLWYPTSSALFRKSALSCLSGADPADWRICADCLLFCYTHLLGNSGFIPFQLSAYRRHGDNGFGGDVIVGKRRYMEEKSKKIANEMYGTRLPLSLLRLFSFFLNSAPDFSVEFMKTILYHAGPGFLLKNWNEVFSCFQMPSFLQRGLLLFKTVIRHTQLMRKVKKNA